MYFFICELIIFSGSKKVDLSASASSMYTGSTAGDGEQDIKFINIPSSDLPFRASADKNRNTDVRFINPEEIVCCMNSYYIYMYIYRD